MASKIRAELMKVAALKEVKGETEAQMLVRLQGVISDEITDEQWAGLSDAAQDWNNAAADAIKGGSPAPAFPDDEPEAGVEQAKPSARRRGAMTDGTQGATGMEVYVPKVGDPVIVTTKRDKVAKGIIVDLTEDEVVVNEKGNEGDEDDDKAFARSQVASIVLQAPDLNGAGGPAPEDDAKDNEPEVGDSITVTTKRGKIITGNLLELTEEIMVLVDPAGEEHEFSPAQTKEVKVVAKGKPKLAVGDKTRPETAPKAEPAPEPEKPAGRRRGAAAAAKEEPAAEPDLAAEAAPKRRGSAKADAEADAEAKRSPAGVGTRARDLIIENPKWTLEQLEKALQKEGLSWRGATVSMIYKDTSYVLKKAGVVK